MSTKGGVHHQCNRPPASAPTSTREPLPMDVLLEIVARSDVTTIVRCTRASKLLRRSILDPAFRGRLELRAAAADGGGCGFDPALLIGVSYLTYGPGMVHNHHIIHTPSSIWLHPRLLACSLPDSFEPVASRGHLLLLRRFGSFPEPENAELRVCDTTTGHRTSLPNPAVSVSHVHAFLSVSGGGSYELFVMDKQFRFQTFSSKHGQWDAVRQASYPWHPYNLAVGTSSRPPVVIGRTIYRLCRIHILEGCPNGILALDAHAAQARKMKLPPGVSPRTMLERHLLLASVRGRLSLLVVDKAGISMWTLTPASSIQPVAVGTWSRRLVIGAGEMAFFSSPWFCALEEFGERSGALIVQDDKGKLLRLDLGTKLATRLHRKGDASATSLFLHETDLTSLLKKSFLTM